jgi:hypothetical protein
MIDDLSRLPFVFFIIFSDTDLPHPNPRPSTNNLRPSWLLFARIPLAVMDPRQPTSRPRAPLLLRSTPKADFFLSTRAFVPSLLFVCTAKLESAMAAMV